MTSMPQADADAYRDQGYVLVKRMFAPDEVRDLRERIRSARDADVAAGNVIIEPAYPHCVNLLGDLPSKAPLRTADYVLFDERVVSCIRALLGERLVYFGDSSIQTGEGRRAQGQRGSDRSRGAGLEGRL